MPRRPKSNLVSNVFQASMRAGFRRAYNGVQVDPQKYLQQFRKSHRLPIQTWTDMFNVEQSLVNRYADRVIRASTRTAAFEGAGFGLGGMLTILPDAGILSAITVRMLQKLSLIYGFEYQTEDEVTELWFAAASAAGLDLGRDFIEKQAVERIVPRIIDRIAVRVGAEVAEKWTGRLIPLLSSGFGGTLNYYFVRSWGRRAQKHFLARHRAVRSRSLPDSDSKLLNLPSRTRLSTAN
ncbi:MAG: EcsC family protein [Candidatus Acidiferrales bacterium]